MDLRDQLSALRRRWLTVVLALVVIVVGTAVVTALLPRSYTASAELFFGVEGGSSVSDLNEGSSYTQQQMTSYVRVATSPLVLQPVITKLGLDTTPDQLAQSITATAPLNTVILEIDVTDADAARSARIANAVAAQVTSVADRLVPPRSDGVSAVQVTVLAPAVTPPSPSSPQVALSLGIAAALGLVIGAVLALLQDALATKVSSEREVRDVTDRPILGMIPNFGSGNPRLALDAGAGDLRSAMHAESVRRLRTNLQFVDLTTPTKTVVVSSSLPDEGKTTTVINLGLALADAGQKVVIVDADLHRPAIAASLGLDGSVGLTSVLLGRATLAEALQPCEPGTLVVLPAGELPPTGGDLLGTRRMRELLDDLAERFDIVLIDSPSLLTTTDGLVLSKIVDGTIIVAGSGRVHRRQLASTIESLQTIDVEPLGIVLNRVKGSALPTRGADAARPAEWQLPPTAVRTAR